MDDGKTSTCPAAPKLPGLSQTTKSSLPTLYATHPSQVKCFNLPKLRKRLIELKLY